MKTFLKIIATTLILFGSTKQFAQHHSKLCVEVNMDKYTINVFQEMTFNNNSNDTINTIILNDWNSAYSNENTLLAKRFSDEFVRTFHLSSENEKGGTNSLTIIDGYNRILDWNRLENNTDIIEVDLKHPVLPHQKAKFLLTYVAKIPSNKFTKYGYATNGEMNLKNWFLSPARRENHEFIKYSNADIDDIANALSDYEIELKVASNFEVCSDLDENTIAKNPDKLLYFSGKNRSDFSLFIEPISSFKKYKDEYLEVSTNLKDKKLTDIQKAIIIHRIVDFVNAQVGDYPYQKITVSQADYDRNPFYGLNQLPSFLSPFPDEFIYELKFLKTYLNNFLKNSLTIDNRKDNWIVDGIQISTMMNYINEFHSDKKMLGNLSNIKLLKSYNIITLDFNSQYSYFYLLMARKNLDQPLGESKEKLIRFNEKIASKYRSGLSLKYLNDYLGDSIVPKSINEFYTLNTQKQTSRDDFEVLLKNNAQKDIDWFFNTIIDSRDIIDYKFKNFSKTKDSVTFTIKNKSGVTVPIPVYGIKKKQVVFKTWMENVATDSTITVNRNEADKIVINYKNEVPEYNLRNNWKSLKGFSTNRPVKFVFLKDLEDPYYNQILFVPTLTYNVYDGLSPGIRFNNKTILDRPFLLDFNPIYSVKTNSLVGSFSMGVNQNYRVGKINNVKYNLSGSYFHYAPDAAYLKINPSVGISLRDADFRDNRKQGFNFKYNIVSKETSSIINDTIDNYSVLDIKYFNSKNEFTKLISYNTNLQLSGTFGKMIGELQYRKLFDNNHRVNIRMYAGAFLYNSIDNSNDYNFGISRINDYLFEYNLYGRSETTGFWSQQYIPAQGGFKSFLNTTSANQWLVTTNVNFNIWNWIEIYGDAGLVKNKYAQTEFIYDSGILLNLVPDYLELYFPVYSNNGLEINQSQYPDKIRFLLTFSTKSIINLFTRKWF